MCVVMPAVGDAAIVKGLASSSGTGGEVAGLSVWHGWPLVIIQFHQAQRKARVIPGNL